MWQICISKIKPYREIILFSLLTFVKLLVFNQILNIQQQFFMVSIGNFITIVAIYFLVNVKKGDRKIHVFMIVHFLISLLFFIDSMYYSHFHTLIPTHSIYQVRHVGGVMGSVWTLMKPAYFLFFIDFLLLWIYYKSYYKRQSIPKDQFKNSQRTISLVAGLILLTAAGGLSYQTTEGSGRLYTPYNLGVINYHYYDVIKFLTHHIGSSSYGEELLEEWDVYERQYLNTDQRRAFGIASNCNVIIIQAESLQSFVIGRQINGQPVTPVLNGLIEKDSIYFSRFYEQVGWGNTSDAEFVSLNSLYPSTKNFSYKDYEENQFVTLLSLLKERGYSTIAFHGNNRHFWNRNQVYPSIGVDQFISQEDLEEEERIGLGLSDISVFKQSIQYLKQQRQPFCAFFVTLTSHYPYDMEGKYRELVVEDFYRETLLEMYLQSIHYLDKAIGELIHDLKRNHLYENTLIVIYGDHHGLGGKDEELSEFMTSFLGEDYREDEMLRVPLIIHLPGSGFREEITRVGGQIDFFPTMANLLGISIIDTKILGQDLLNATKGFVAIRPHIGKGSFIDDEKIFIIAKDGSFENGIAWNIHTKEPVEIETCREGYERAIADITLSEYLMKNNLIYERLRKETDEKEYD